MVKTWVIWDEKDGSVWVGSEKGAFSGWSWLLRRPWFVRVGPVEFEELGRWVPTRFSAGWVMVGSNGAGTSMGCQNAGAS
jgi:hypothetical protein